jgi:hypothetical protein
MLIEQPAGQAAPMLPKSAEPKPGKRGPYKKKISD